MVSLTTKYLGLTLRNPIIAGSCDLTSSIETIKELERNGVSAIVLKSIFEEEILLETNAKLREADESNLLYSELSETLDYIDLHTRQNRLSEYLGLIKKLKNEILIPVIASINCITDSEWLDFAKQIERAGADALELNIFINPATNLNIDIEKAYIDITSKVLSRVSIPVSVKISHYFTRPQHIIEKLSKTGIAGIVLFNRFYQFDIDTEKQEVISASKTTLPSDILLPLRWITLLSGKVTCSIAASTGVHDGNGAIKLLLAGADAVEVVSALYLKGPGHINKMLSEIEEWMEKNNYNSIGQFKGKLSYSESTNPAVYERIQFMKYFSEL